MLQQVKMSNDGVFQYPLLSANIEILVFSSLNLPGLMTKV